jgi:cell division protein ZapA
MSKNKVTVTIAGREYTIVSNEAEEYLQRLAEHLDKKVTELAYSNNQITLQMATVLAAVNVTDEYFKSIETADNLRQQVGQYIEDVSKDRAELTSLRAENERLREQLKRYAPAGGIPMSGQQSII